MMATSKSKRKAKKSSKSSSKSKKTKKAKKPKKKARRKIIVKDKIEPIKPKEHVHHKQDIGEAT